MAAAGAEQQLAARGQRLQCKHNNAFLISARFVLLLFVNWKEDIKIHTNVYINFICLLLKFYLISHVVSVIVFAHFCINIFALLFFLLFASKRFAFSMVF